MASWFAARVARHPESDPVDTPGKGPDVSDLGCRLGLLWVRIRRSYSSLVASEAGVTVLLHGEVYGPSGARTAEGLLEAYLRYGPSVARSLNGSFALLVLDNRLGGLLVITDRVNSHKVFLSEDDGGWWLSTSLYRHPGERRRLDPAGIASVLACGAAHGGLTPFEGVRVLEPAAVHSFTERGHRSESYWDYESVAQSGSVRESDLRGGLADALRSSVERRIPSGQGKLFVSLSGGYDSRSIAGFLSEAIDDRERLQIFTYHHGPQVGDTDFGTASGTAISLGVHHQRMEGYKGDLPSVLEANSSFGQGMANFCTEIGVWQSLGPSMAESDENLLFVGDRFPLASPRSEDGAALLAQADVFPVSTIEWLLKGLGSSSASALGNGWRAAYEGLLAKIPSGQDVFDSLHRVKLEHRTDTIMLWRECFQTPYVRVANPYFDNEVLDFMSQVPARSRKRLYRDAITAALPSLFREPTVDGGWNPPDWPRELRHHAASIRNAVVSVPSRLDELIPPDVILRLLKATSGVSATGSDEAVATLRSLTKRLTLVRQMVRAVKPRVRRSVPIRRSRHQVLLDLLTLRGFLSETLPRSVAAGRP
ncbi:MAG: hypothetical protein GXP34_14525 [Actinobacteria bacterium]|nr:hypothetical protein [Actinomycetota bacterium]